MTITIKVNSKKIKRQRKYNEEKEKAHGHGTFAVNYMRGSDSGFGRIYCMGFKDRSSKNEKLVQEAKRKQKENIKGENKSEKEDNGKEEDEKPKEEKGRASDPGRISFWGDEFLQQKTNCNILPE